MYICTSLCTLHLALATLFRATATWESATDQNWNISDLQASDRILRQNWFYRDLTGFWAPKSSKHGDLSALSHARVLKTMRGPKVLGSHISKTLGTSQHLCSARVPKPWGSQCFRLPKCKAIVSKLSSRARAAERLGSTRRFGKHVRSFRCFVGSVPAEIVRIIFDYTEPVPCDSVGATNRNTA